MCYKEILECLANAKTETFILKENEVIRHQEASTHCLYIVLEGKVEVSLLTSLNIIMYSDVFKPFDCFGEKYMCANTASFTLHTLENSKLLAINLHNLIGSTPEYLLQRLMTNLMNHIATQNLMLTRQIQYGQISSLKKRVALFLLNYYEENKTTLFTVPFNREEMAKYLSATRPALSKVLSEFKQLELIDYYKDSFKINDLVNLKKIINKEDL